MGVDDMVAEIMSGKKHSGIAPAAVRRLCMEMAHKHPQKKSAIKAVKKELHIMHESFLKENCYRDAIMLLSRIEPGSDRTRLAAVSQEIMQLHVSTRERSRDIEKHCAFIGDHVSKGCSVVDIGCGFNPFSLAMIGEPPAAYHAYDVCLECVSVLNAFFALLGRARYRAEPLDAVSDTPGERADIALLLKILPVLQRQKPGRGFRILEELDYEKAIVSFPTRSVGGRRIGMEGYYSKFFEDGLHASLKIMEKQVFSNEMYYVIGHARPGAA